MVQLSDIYDSLMGASVSQRQDKIYAGEAHLLWEHLQQRHDYLELTMICLNNIKDSDFRVLVSMGLRNTMSKQIKEVETMLGSFGIPIPEGAPQSVTTKGDPEIWRDEFIFNLLLTGIRNFLNVHLRGVKMFMSDGMREMFGKYMDEELKIHDSLIKYGKIKGWVLSPPAYGQ